MERYPLAGAELTLAPDRDRAGFGVEMMWLDAARDRGRSEGNVPGHLRNAARLLAIWRDR